MSEQDHITKKLPTPFISQIEPSSVNQALKDDLWVKSMKEELIIIYLACI